MSGDQVALLPPSEEPIENTCWCHRILIGFSKLFEEMKKTVCYYDYDFENVPYEEQKRCKLNLVYFFHGKLK